jgi:hypothetical protein
METIEGSVGERFVDALLAKDWPRLDTVLDPEVDLRALTPGRPWEATGTTALVEEVFSHWFEPTDDIYEVLEVATDHIADRHRVIYRFRVRNPDGDYVCEQTAYYDEAGGRITKLRILCSGFLPSDSTV